MTAAPPAAAAADPATTRASVSGRGVQADGVSGAAAVSADGRYVAFTSAAANLVPGDTNGRVDVFVRDRQTGSTSRVSGPDDGTDAGTDTAEPAISADGRYVAFTADAPHGGTDVWVRDRTYGSSVRVNVSGAGLAAGAGSRSSAPAISASGRFIAFQSNATNLVPGAGGGGGVFVHDMRTGVTRRVSVSGSGRPADQPAGHPAISADGQYIAFESTATNLVPRDTNGVSDVFLRDLAAGITRRVSVSGSGAQAAGASFAPTIDGLGWLVGFESAAPDLVARDTNGRPDVFLRDWQAGTTRPISVSGAGVPAGGYGAALSPDGGFVAFTSDAADLVPRDTNAAADVFVRDWIAGTTRRASVSGGNGQGDAMSYAASLSAGGHVVCFLSRAVDLIPADGNAYLDVFLRLS